jgi:hypothetical protein
MSPCVTDAVRMAVSCLDVYGPHPIASGFGKLWSKGHNC